MSKNTIYLLTAIVMLILIAIIWYPKAPALAPAANPANGLTGDSIKPTGQTLPESVISQSPKDKAMDSDDVPAGAEVAPAPAPNAAKPEDKGLAVPPSEGQ